MLGKKRRRKKDDTEVIKAWKQKRNKLLPPDRRHSLLRLSANYRKERKKGRREKHGRIAHEKEIDWGKGKVLRAQLQDRVLLPSLLEKIFNIVMQGKGSIMLSRAGAKKKKSLILEREREDGL